MHMHALHTPSSLLLRHLVIASPSHRLQEKAKTPHPACDFLTPTWHHQTAELVVFLTWSALCPQLCLCLFPKPSSLSFLSSLTDQLLPTFEIQLQSHLLHRVFPNFPLAVSQAPLCVLTEPCNSSTDFWLWGIHIPLLLDYRVPK